MHVIGGYKKLGTEISFAPLMSFTLAKLSFTLLPFEPFTRLRSTALWISPL